jgi:hypothetical protein
MTQNGRVEGLLVRAEPLQWAREISLRMVDVVRIVDGALLLEVDPEWAGAINTVLVEKGVRVDELHKKSKAEWLISQSRAQPTRTTKKGGDLRW